MEGRLLKEVKEQISMHLKVQGTKNEELLGLQELQLLEEKTRQEEAANRLRTALTGKLLMQQRPN